MENDGKKRQAAAVDEQRGMPKAFRILDYCFSDGVPRRSLMVGLVVGTILNAINQGDVLLHGGHVNVVKMILTYAVPYCVATYGAVSFRLAAMRVSSSAENGATEPTRK